MKGETNEKWLDDVTSHAWLNKVVTLANFV